ncbi:Uma2 family endonuclease [Candidatus Marithioploca araucensis]|uniref:Uma2 family endonuclease n=1 Tax=Candidatus Marithioploca araucensis TaxID=70273 RepID=A0ABT7VRY8_9GAMM|nr:Uma2 family endonuclease [Candidatus Marithioploca araucensis]
MSEVIDFENEIPDEEREMGSFNHSLTQSNLTSLLHNDERFTTLVEFSLEPSKIDLSQFDLKAKDELKPDVCVYTNPPTVEPPDDLVKTTQMPDLAIEILSPLQTVSELISKLKAYFALSVKSCWLVSVHPETTLKIPKLKLWTPKNGHLGVQSFSFGSVSGWTLVIPATQSITVFSQSKRYKTFGTDTTIEIIDEIMDICLPIAKVFKIPSKKVMSEPKLGLVSTPNVLNISISSSW